MSGPPPKRARHSDSSSLDRDEDPNDIESLDVIGEKLKAIAKVNREVLDAIDAKKNRTVTSGFVYTLNCNLDQNEINRGREKPWDLTATAQNDCVASRLQAWCYDGQPLEEAEDVFNDKINYQMTTYTDVVRLNNEMLKVGSKYCDLLADKPKTRSGLRTFVANLEVIQVAIGQLNELIFHAEDEISGSDDVQEGMSKIVEGFMQLQKKIPVAALRLSCNNFVVGCATKVTKRCRRHRIVNCQNGSCRREIHWG